MLAALGLSAWSLRRSARLARRLESRPPAQAVAAGPRALQHVGVVRFNPYHDTGGDYSFAVALLDAAGDGVVLTGLYHRDRCRVYAKAVREGGSEQTLSEEERQAIEQARAGER